MNTYSLASVTLTLSNNALGTTIQIGGGQKLVGQVSYAFANDIFTMETTPDGGAVFSHNNSRAATVDIQLKHTSGLIPLLTQYFKNCQNNPDMAEGSLTCTDKTGNIAFSATGVFPVKIPENSVGAQAGDRTFSLAVAQLIPQEDNFGSTAY